MLLIYLIILTEDMKYTDKNKKGGVIMRKLRKSVAVLLSTIMLTSMVGFNVIAQEQGAKATGKENLEIIADENGKLEYTYMEEGKQYKVVEYTENETVESYVYVMNSSGEYVLQSHLNTYFEYTEDGFVARRVENGKETVVTLSEDVFEPSGVSTRSTPPPPPGGGYGWKKVFTTKGSTKFINATLAGIRQALSSLATALANKYWNAGVAIGAGVLSAMANAYYIRDLDYAYMVQVGYYYYPTGKVVPTKIRTYTYGYAKSNYTDLVDSTVSESEIVLGGN